ncbi:hypothetical protein FSP39_016919 [Pinctada imbricata]|uniref:NACHT domain-containing protein n=1 Tax=Pinctada imbricata TaxID=66713 RepID=A0AA89C3I6_PINIB|nr:hypothetical protein FSP39_016919 [Pinctada imbricata]
MQKSTCSGFPKETGGSGEVLKGQIGQPMGGRGIQPYILVKLGKISILCKFQAELDPPNHSRSVLVYVEPDVSDLKQKLIERNNKETREIPLSPVTTDGDKLPIEHLFSSVVIREDVKENRKGKKSAQREEQQEGKEVKSPEDMLTKDGKPVPRVFMLGKAAHGKTTYCKWFLKTWCNSQQPGMSGRPLNKWENALSQFDFVFHIPLRHVDPSRADVTDMICQDILGSDPDLQATAKHVLSSKKYRCFIMMDGLDEWKPDQSVIDRLKYKGMPNIDNMSNCVIFTTMRPWKFSEVEGVNSEDRVIEILGLDDAGIELVIEKVLVHYYEMKPETAECEAKCTRIKSKLQNKTVKSFVKIPLLAVVCVQIWYEGRQTRDSMTSFYSELTDMLIERALAKIKYQITENKETEYSLPETLLEKENIVANISILLKLGKVAYNGLLSNKESLEFQKRKLEKEIGKKELQFVLDVGLISEKEAHGITTKNVSVHFFHKSVQEFLAAIYIVTHKKVSVLFCKHLWDIKVIMELSNVIMFICGMCPCLGSVISQRVVSVADSDTKICEYRESPGGNSTVKELYKLQVSWLRELEYGQTDSPVTDSPVTFHVSDVYLYKYSDIETVRGTRELLSDHHIDIGSLYLFMVPTDGEGGITNTVVNNFLRDPHRTRSLTMVYIDGRDTDRTINKVCVPSLRTLRLRYVKVANTNTVPGPVLCQCDRLQRLWLDDVTLGDRDLGLTPNMTLLQWVTLHTVNMTSSGWGRWLQSVIDIHHLFGVTLWDTNIDRHTVSTIHSSPHLSSGTTKGNCHNSQIQQQETVITVRYNNRKLSSQSDTTTGNCHHSQIQQQETVITVRYNNRKLSSQSDTTQETVITVRYNNRKLTSQSDTTTGNCHNSQIQQQETVITVRYNNRKLS